MRVAVLLAVLTSSLALAGAQGDRPAAPRLVVLIVVDQMRADYVDRFRAEWTGGFKRLLGGGAWYRAAAYPYLDTVTCAGHATIATGAFPPAHGIFHNAWWDRAQAKSVTCTEDPTAPDIGYGFTPRGGDSGRRLLAPTFADELRGQRGARVVSLSLKDRSAIMPAGHGGDAVTWMANDLTGWLTSAAFTTTPVPAVRAFLDANPIDAEFGKVWTRLLPESRYREPDEGIGEQPPAGWSRTFPHALSGVAGQPDRSFSNQWIRSPYADAYLARFATALATAFELGRGNRTDVLAVSFSTPDIIGHAFGPRSQEIHDEYLQLDRTLGVLLDALDTMIGRDRYVVALSADHGVSDIPEQSAGGGHIDGAALVAAVEQRAQAALGPGQYVATLSGNDLYFRPDVYAQLAAKPGVAESVIAAISAQPGIARVYRAAELAKAPPANAPADQRAAASSYVPGASGDLIIVQKPGWISGSNATTHGSASPDDQRVPIVLWGRGIKPGEYTRPVTPADIAPTLAALCGITMPRAEGHPLREALAPPVASAR